MAPLDKHTLLLVDDEPEILFSMKSLLRLDYNLHTANNGTEALEILDREEIHVLMTDQRMPEMTGTEVLRRARETHPQVVRLLFTGFADIKAVIDAINVGHVYRYISKPVDPDELLRILQEACEEYELQMDRQRLREDVREYIEQSQDRHRETSANALVELGDSVLRRLTQRSPASEQT